MKPGDSLAAIALACAAGSAIVGAAACLDLTPVLYEVPGHDATPPMVDVSVDVPIASDTALPDDSGDVRDAAAPEVYMPPTCVGCLGTPDDAGPPGCGSELALCLANTECAATYACAVATGCFQQPSFRAIVQCGIPCAEEAGIMSTSDPAVTLIYNIACCATIRCVGTCSVGDAALACGDF